MTKRTLSIALSVLLLLTAFTGFALASAITIVEQPEAVKGYKGETATFSVEAEGDDLEYQWQMRAKKGEAYKDIKGANEESYTTPLLLNSHSHRRFQVIITDGDGHKVVSESANLIVRPASIRITENPGAQKIDAGETATYSVKAEGPGSLSYQWQKRLPGEKEYLNIEDANEASYTTGEMSVSDSHSRFRCVVTNDKGMESISGSANLLVRPAKEVPTEAPSEEPSEGPDSTSSSAPGASSTPDATATAVPTATAAATAAPTAAPGGGGGGGQITNVAVTGISLNLAIMKLEEGGTSGTISAVVSPSNATNKSVTWTSSDAAVARVAAGIVTPVAEGNATITATTVDGGFTATCEVTVSQHNAAKLYAPAGVALEFKGSPMRAYATWSITANQTGVADYQLSYYEAGNDTVAGTFTMGSATATSINLDAIFKSANINKSYVFAVQAIADSSSGMQDSEMSDKTADALQVISGSPATLSSVNYSSSTETLTLNTNLTAATAGWVIGYASDGRAIFNYILDINASGMATAPLTATEEAQLEKFAVYTFVANSANKTLAIALSEKVAITEPAAGLPTPQNLRIEGDTLLWDGVVGATNYRIQFYDSSNVFVSEIYSIEPNYPIGYAFGGARYLNNSGTYNLAVIAENSANSLLSNASSAVPVNVVVGTYSAAFTPERNGDALTVTLVSGAFESGYSYTGHALNASGSPVYGFYEVGSGNASVTINDFFSIGDAGTAVKMAINRTSWNGSTLTLDKSSEIDIVDNTSNAGLAAPQNVRISGDELVWDSVANATSYEILAYDSSNGLVGRVSNHTQTSCGLRFFFGNANGLNSSGAVTLKVKAVNTAQSLESAESALPTSVNAVVGTFSAVYTAQRNGDDIILTLDSGQFETTSEYTIFGLNAGDSILFSMQAMGSGSGTLTGSHFFLSPDAATAAYVRVNRVNWNSGTTTITLERNGTVFPITGTP